MDETPRQRRARLVQAADRRIAEILNNYEGVKQKHRAAEAESRAGRLIETLVAGGMSAERAAAFRRDLDEVTLLTSGTSSIPEDVKDEIVRWTSPLSQIQITSETSRHWREATVRDVEKIVLLSKNYGEVWCDHPFLKNEPQYFTDFQHFCVKQAIDFGVNDHFDCVAAYRMYEGSMYGAMQYWCPVKRKFMTEGEMRRQEHWFHNGDGSVQQQYFYSQNEMLDMYGGSVSLHLGFDLHILAASILTAASSANDELIITQVRSASQVIDDKFKEAVRQGKVMDLT
jgi:hypothetical protein